MNHPIFDKSYANFVFQLKADEESGRRGYQLTFMIAYIRDIVMDYNFIAESFGMHIIYFETTSINICLQKPQFPTRMRSVFATL